MMQKNLELNSISALDFTTQCIRIADAYTIDASLVDGRVFAHLAKQLIAHETQPGGPYRDETGVPTIPLNAAIGRLFLLMGHPLPHVATYLRGAATHLSNDDRAALVKYETALESVQHKEYTHPEQHASYRLATKTLTTLEEPVRTQALQFLARIEKADVTREIAAISEFAAQGLTGSRIPVAKLNALGEANVHSWIAYSIYDHILDNEAGTALLPAANICMRTALKIYQQSLPKRHPIQLLIEHYFEKVDTASAWEIAACRAHISDESISIGTLPRYNQYEILAWRSCIHILGPLIVAASSPMSDMQTEQFTEGLHNYLIARQLSDDIHDWREDLTAGRISAVVALLLERQDIQADSAYNLATLVNAIQRDFLAEGAVNASRLILQHAKIAQEKLAAAGCEPSSKLMGLALRLERMATESIHQQHRFTGFQDEYMTTS